MFRFTEYIDEVLSGNDRDEFVDGRLAKRYFVECRGVAKDSEGPKEVIEWVLRMIKEEGLNPPRVLAVFNTVDEAIKAYRLAIEKLPIRRDRIILLHSRFASADREAITRRIEDLSKEARGGDGDPYAVISTQAVEAGVDLTSNIFATDAAPPTTIIQRAGRFLRYGEVSGKALILVGFKG